jgi:hypothetical protein
MMADVISKKGLRLSTIELVLFPTGVPGVAFFLPRRVRF